MLERQSVSVATVELSVNGLPVRVLPGSMVAAVILNVGAACRLSEMGELRAPLCGMGICFECRANVDGILHERTCQMECREGMTVVTQR